MNSLISRLRPLRGFMFAALVTSGCSGNESHLDSTVRVQVFTGAYSSIPVHVALEKGFFDAQGLSVEILPANSSSAALAAMIGGSLDIVESAADLVMANIDKGTDLKYLMSNESTNYVTVVVGNHVDLPAESRAYPAIIEHFKGRRVGVNAIGSTVYLAGVMMLEEAGVSVDEVEFVATGSAATTMSAWRSGSVDIQITFAPVPELLSTLDLAEPFFVLADHGPPALKFDGLYGGWVTTGEFVLKRSEQADGFIAAMKEAIDWIRDPDNAADMLELTTRHAPISALSNAENQLVIADMIDRYRRFWGYEISHKAIQMWNDYALRFNLIKRRIEFDDIVYSGAPTCTDSCR